MECVLGAFGGLGTSIAFIIEYDRFESITHSLEMNGGPLLISASVSKILLIVFIVLLCLDMSHYFILNGEKSSDDIKKLFLNGVITEDEYKKRVTEEKKNAKKYLIFENICEGCEPFIYAGFPFLLISLGDISAARVVSFFIIFWVIIQEVCFEKLTSKYLGTAAKLLGTAAGIAILVADFVYAKQPDYRMTVLMYGVFYEAITLFWIVYRHFYKNKHEEKPTLSGLVKSATTTVHVYFTLCIIFITVIVFMI